MGWSNGPRTWKEMHRVLSDGRPRNVPPGAEGDSPAWSRKRMPYQRPRELQRRDATHVPYAELHCHSAYSWLDGASHPEKLAEEAARLGLDALAITDHDGMYGIVRFAEAARVVGLPTIFGSELTVGARRIPNGIADPEGDHLVALARDPFGYARLCRAISLAQLRGEKGRPVHRMEELAELCGGRWVVLTGCRKGAVPRALVDRGPSAARDELARLIEAFGRDNVAVELWDHGDPLDSHRNDTLAEIAAHADVQIVATNNVHYATPKRFGLYTALQAIRARRSLEEMDGWLPPAPTAHLRSGAEQARRFARYPGAVERAAEIGLACAFDLRLIAPNLPPYPVPQGETEATFLRQITYEGALKRYGPRDDERVEGAWAQIDKELHVIEQMSFPGYFLIVWDIVEFCRRSDILCQGRGSAANSAVCYALGITNADAVSLGLLFERFLSPARDGPPDIDIDIEAGRREEAIQYVYNRYGRHNAAQVANVITYRPRSAIRDAAKALGYSQGQQDAWSKQIDGWNGSHEGSDIPENVLQLGAAIEGLPRHLGIHSGGMVLASRPVIEVCPVEWGRMEDRTVLQWDKDDCAEVGLVKFDLLGLGMLTAIHEAIDLVREAHGVDIDIAMLPQDSAVYDMLCEADTVGVFQIESRAQMATLPRLKPRTFYDLVVEVALIRPGPIQGGSVHPYLKRRNGQERVTYLHPLLQPALEKTLGVPLFQEQLMQIAIDVAGFTAADADELRQAMGSKRSHERMQRLKGRFYDGMAARGITGEVADQIWDKLEAFANFGFPESHSVSFSYLVYISAWLKYHYPAAFCAALLNAQPMGFWSPHTLVADARRHGVVVRSVDINASDWKARVEPLNMSAPRGPAVAASGGHENHTPDDRQDVALRLGISYVRSIGEDLAKEIAAGRPYSSVDDVVRRCGLTKTHAEALATSGAFSCFEPSRRKTLWTAGASANTGQGSLPGMTVGDNAPDLPEMTEMETAAADLWSTSMMTNGSPMEFVRPMLDERGVLTAEALKATTHGRRVQVAGVVTHRQRPATAEGVTFLNLEDETGLVNVICSVGLWRRYRRTAVSAKAMLVTGRLEHVEGVINLVADRLETLDLNLATTSRDFR